MLGGFIAVVVMLVAAIVAHACYVPPIEVCLDDSATNYQGSLPCVYLPVDEVTPTEEPKCTENCGTPPTFQGSTTNPPAAATCNIPFEVARTWYGNGKLYWASDEQGVQRFSITYGPDKDHMIYGIDNIPAGTGVRSIDKPKSGFKQTWFSVWTWKDGCANQSTPIDP